MKSSIPGIAMLLAGAVLCSASAQAADSAITTSASVALTSDYLFRGVSQTSNNAAVQGAMTINHASGAYLSFWASSIASTAGGQELDSLLGYTGKSGDMGYDLGVMRYNYPGANKASNGFNPDYNEIYASISGLGGKLGLNYSPDYYQQSDVYLYVYAGYGADVGGVTVSGSLGLNRFDSPAMMTRALALNPANSNDSYMDYKLAVAKTVGGFGIEGAIIGSDIDEVDCDGGLCDGRFVVTISRSL